MLKSFNMTTDINQPFPPSYTAIDTLTKSSGFTMASDVHTCTLLRTLAATKPTGSFLELGTGTGLSTSWILDGMDSQASLISIDNDSIFLAIAQAKLGSDKRLELVQADGGAWIIANKHRQFDYIFADTWHGKYLLLEETLSMLRKGGLYIVDDMLPQPNWPDGHDEKAWNLVNLLEQRNDLLLTKMIWATGIIIAVKK
jgi:predicted O-methyltransferase YrrM